MVQEVALTGAAGAPRGCHHPAVARCRRPDVLPRPLRGLSITT